MKILTFLFVLPLFVTSACAEFTTKKLEALRKKHDIPGAAAAYVSPSRVDVWATGYRKIHNATAIQPTDKFHLGSCTKAMTATLVAILVERNQLKWETTLGEMYPGVKMDERFKQVTFGMLTAHMSGIEGDMREADHGRLIPALRALGGNVFEGRRHVVETLLGLPPKTEPGSKFEYSNFNYVIAAAILEKTTGKSWEKLMKTEIFEPLRMDSCGFGNAANPVLIETPDQPWPHHLDGRIQSLLPDFLAENPQTIAPAAGVHCNLKDWSSFLRIHIDGFNGLDTPILKAKGFKKLHTAYPGQEFTYGGWMRLNRKWAKGPVLHHSGSNKLNYANVWLAPKRKQGFVSATNYGTDPQASEFMDAIVSSVLENSPPKGK